MARVPAPSDPSGWPMVLGAGETWYAKPDAGALLVSPAEEDPVEPARRLGRRHRARRGDRPLRGPRGRRRSTRLLASWAGLRTFAPDRQLVIGPDPLDETFLWCAGQGGYGFQTACAASRLLADAAAGRETDLAGMLSPRRLRPAPPRAAELSSLTSSAVPEGARGVDALVSARLPCGEPRGRPQDALLASCSRPWPQGQALAYLETHAGQASTTWLGRGRAGPARRGQGAGARLVPRGRPLPPGRGGNPPAPTGPALSRLALVAGLTLRPGDNPAPGRPAPAGARGP